MFHQTLNYFGLTAVLQKLGSRRVILTNQEM